MSIENVSVGRECTYPHPPSSTNCCRLQVRSTVSADWHGRLLQPRFPVAPANRVTEDSRRAIDSLHRLRLPPCATQAVIPGAARYVFLRRRCQALHASDGSQAPYLSAAVCIPVHALRKHLRRYRLPIPRPSVSSTLSVFQPALRCLSASARSRRPSCASHLP